MTKTIYTQLLLAQTEFPRIELDSVNPHFKSKYASLPNVLSIVNPILNKHGIVHYSTQEEGKPDVLVLHLYHPESDTCLKSHIKLLNMSDMQKWSGSCTHAERKGLLKLLGIDSDMEGDSDMDDDGNSASTPIKQTTIDVTPAQKQVQKAFAAPELALEEIIILKDNILNLWDIKKESALKNDAERAGNIGRFITNDFMNQSPDGELKPLPVTTLIQIQTYLKGL